MLYAKSKMPALWSLSLLAFSGAGLLCAAGHDVNDQILIDRSLKAAHGDIVLALIKSRAKLLQTVCIRHKKALNSTEQRFGKH